MDLWVVAAAAGAGYLAKYWNKISKNGESGSSSHFSSDDSDFQNPKSPMHPSIRRPRDNKFANNDALPLDRRGAADARVNSSFENFNDNDVLCVSKLPALFSANENFNDTEDGNDQSSEVIGNCAFLHPDSSRGEVGSTHNTHGNKKSLRTKHLYGRISKPLNSLESCLMAQLQKENAEMVDYVFSSHSLPPTTTTRSFLVSDGSRIISRANNDAYFSSLFRSEEYKLHSGGASQVKDKNVLFGVPSLPKIRSFDDSRMQFNTGNGQRRRLSSSNNVLKHITAQRDATFIFSLGISFGIITCVMANKREMGKLRELLKHNENLVQDLQEELEMKDSMTVKELHGENYGSQDTCDHSFSDKDLNGFSPEKHTDNSPVIDIKKSYNQKEEESSESMSKIEAELEAELERLGLNMNESSLDRRLSELVEIDQDFVADFAQGELRPDMVSGEDIVHSKSDEDSSGTTNIPVNHAVSPRALSLRLHEVIQSRLEKRVEELEIALQNSQRKLRSMELEHDGCSLKHFPSSGQASSFTNGNIYDDCEHVTEPLVMNLSGEALGAYNEAYEELIKIYESEEHSPSGIYNEPDQKPGSYSSDWLASGVQQGRVDDPMIYSNGDELSRELISCEPTTLAGQSSRVNELSDTSGDENCDCDYELERQLIMQIVERTKKDSPVLQNARKILYSMDEDEQ